MKAISPPPNSASQEVDEAELLALLEPMALAAGQRIMDVLARGCSVEWKEDASPVTIADQEAEVTILSRLRSTFPDTMIVAEEEVSAGHFPLRLDGPCFLVDPLDGTREFVNGKDDFTVNIAYIVDGEPRAGVVYAPARNVLFSGRPGIAESCHTNDDHEIVSRNRITTRTRPEMPIVVASRSHRTAETDEYLAGISQARILSVGSSLKFCMIASGQADCYPRFGPTMQWDTAAGDAVLRAAGGRTLQLDGKPMVYGCNGKPQLGLLANPWFIADGGAPA